VDPISSSTLTTSTTDVSSSAGAASSTAKTASTVASTTPDLIEISAVPSLFEAQQVQAHDPSQYQTVLTDAVRELKAAALQTSDPFEVAYLLDLAGKFQQLQETGSGGSPQTSGQPTGQLSGAAGAGH